MNHSPAKFAAYAALTMLVIIVARTPIAQRIVIAGLVDSVVVFERIVRFPSRLTDHKSCFSLDRFDPTCPQCM